MKRLRTLAALLLIAFAPLEAQDEKPVFLIAPIDAQGASTEDAHMLETLVYSYFADKNDVVIVPQGGITPTSVTPASGMSAGGTLLRAGEPNYFVKCSLYREDDDRVFELVVRDSWEREVSRSTTRHKTTKDIALNMRSIVNSAFQWKNVSLGTADAGKAESPVPETTVPETLVPDKLFGLWGGDAGIKLVRILPDGKAFAFFDSGVNMMLSYKIENNTLSVRQVSPNSERFYYPLPLEAAKVLSKEAEPMRWELRLYSGGNLLSGSRVETVIDSEDYEKLIVRHNSVRKSEWNKLPR
jgi:hypothetical protein